MLPKKRPLLFLKDPYAYQAKPLPVQRTKNPQAVMHTLAMGGPRNGRPVNVGVAKPAPLTNNRFGTPRPGQPKDERNFFSKAWDQINPVDNGRTFKKPTPRIPRYLEGNKIVPRPDSARAQLGKNIQNIRRTVSRGPVAKAALAIKHNVVAPIPNLLRAAVDSQGERIGREMAENAANKFGFTGGFRNTIQNAHPTAYTKTDRPNVAGFAPHDDGITGTYNGIHMSRNHPESDVTLLHEGLHKEYHKFDPKKKQRFGNTVTAVVNQTPGRGLGRYLDYRLQPYGVRAGVLAKVPINKLPERIQNEIHSFVTEYYETVGEEMPLELAQHYAEFYDTDARGRQKERQYTNQVANELVNSSTRTARIGAKKQAPQASGLQGSVPRLQNR